MADPLGALADFTQEVAEDRGLQIVGWSTDTHDWRDDSAAELDRNPAFPHAAFAALKEAGALMPPPQRVDEWHRVRAVSKADGSVGRIFEGHLNTYERLTLEDIDPEDHLLGVWGADPTPAGFGRASRTRCASTARRSWPRCSR
jgi:hypothetical protein